MIKSIRDYLSENPKKEQEKPNKYYRRIAKLAGCTPASAKTIYNRHRHDIEQYHGLAETDKNLPEGVGWRDLVAHAKEGQKVRQKMSGSQNYATWKYKGDGPLHMMVMGDSQIGCFGVDYEKFMAMTDFILNTDGLYVALVGDILQMAINKRSIAEVVSGSALSPEQQMFFVEDWLKEIKHKVICSTWDNHTDMRQEKVMGYSHLAGIWKQHCIYFKGIGHLDLHVGDQVYKGAMSHKFSGGSMYNKAHAPMRYMREKANDREFALMGDIHQPAILDQQYGGEDKLAVVCGSIQNESSYIRRHFSLKTYPYMPIITFGHDEHVMIPYKNYKRWKYREK